MYRYVGSLIVALIAMSAAQSTIGCCDKVAKVVSESVKKNANSPGSQVANAPPQVPSALDLQQQQLLEQQRLMQLRQQQVQQDMLLQQQRCMVPTPFDSGPVPGPATVCPGSPEPLGVLLPNAIITFPDAPEANKVNVEVAATSQLKARGLAYRRYMDANAGMLFDYPGPEQQRKLWMHTVCCALDILFVAQDGFIAGILRNVPPLNDAQRTIPCPVRYVLLVNAGWTERNGVRAGQRIIISPQ